MTARGSETSPFVRDRTKNLSAICLPSPTRRAISIPIHKISYRTPDTSFPLSILYLSSSISIWLERGLEEPIIWIVLHSETQANLFPPRKNDQGPTSLYITLLFPGSQACRFPLCPRLTPLMTNVFFTQWDKLRRINWQHRDWDERPKPVYLSYIVTAFDDRETGYACSFLDLASI